MPAPSPLGTSVQEALDAVPGVSEHELGHRENLLRYATPGGVPFAVGRTEVTGLRFWVLDSEPFRTALQAAGLSTEASAPKLRGSPGRNSSLDQIPEFKRQVLNWTKVTSPAEALAALAVLLAVTFPERPPAVEPSGGEAPDAGTEASDAKLPQTLHETSPEPESLQEPEGEAAPADPDKDSGAEPALVALPQAERDPAPDAEAAPVPDAPSAPVPPAEPEPAVTETAARDVPELATPALADAPQAESQAPRKEPSRHLPVPVPPAPPRRKGVVGRVVGRLLRPFRG
jgi:hypothetical protein